MSEILIRVQGACGRITLNRPQVMNSLNQAMSDEMYDALAAWAHEDRIRFVLVDGAGDRGLCAGGDIRAIYHAMKSGRLDEARAFFHREYNLNYLISQFPKPYVVLMDGVVMGGGIGISSHGSHRVVTERSKLAMPETAIGFIPDVGGTHLLSAAPGETGTWMGLTGSRVEAADAILCGLADRMVPSGDLPRLTLDLEACPTVEEMERCLRGFAAEPQPGTLPERRLWIDTCFAAASVEAIMAALLKHPAAEAQACAQDLNKLSPASLKLTLRALRHARAAGDLASALETEFRLAQECVKGHDFAEGIRAAIVDKDRNPKWSPGRIEDITPEMLEACFSGTDVEALNLSPV